jgi:hypothetical protein
MIPPLHRKPSQTEQTEQTEPIGTGISHKNGVTVRLEKLNSYEGESPSGLAAVPPEFGTKELNGKV